MINIIKYCEYLYNSLYIPVYLYSSTMELITCFPGQGDSAVPPSMYLSKLWDISEGVAYVETHVYSYYGQVKVLTDGIRVIIGPISPFPYTKETLSILHNDFLIDRLKNKPFDDFLNDIPIQNLDDFINTLLLINYTVNHTELTKSDVTHLSNPMRYQEILTKYYENLSASDEEKSPNSNYEIERELFGYIETGNIKKLDMFFINSTYRNYDIGATAENYLQDKKNICITGISLITRAAIKGGLTPHIAYKLSNIYFRQVDHLTEINAIDSLLVQAAYDYTYRTAKSKIPPEADKTLYTIVEYINENIYKNITVAEIAEYMHFNRSYLSRKFKNQIGIELSKYIQQCKLEESKNLLRYSDKSISEISNLLCFSSQSHFQNAFKKQFKITPQTFRNSESMLCNC